MVVILVEEEKMRGMLVVVVGVVDRSPSPTLPRGGSPFLLCFVRFGGTPSLWGGLGRGFWEGWGGASLPLLVSIPLLVFICSPSHGDEINTKSRGHCWRLRLGGDVSNACRKTSFPPGHRRHPHRHATHDASNDHGKKKPPLAVKKVRLAPVEKQLLWVSPSPALPTPLPGPPQMM